MKALMFLFRNFDRELPADFLTSLEELVPSSIILTVNNKVDFNRWDISYRTDKRVIDIIESYNTTHDNILNTYFKFFQTDLNGFIDCNSETREETWNRY